MACRLYGKLGYLCFDPHFAPIQKFLHDASELFAQDICLYGQGVAYVIGLGDLCTWKNIYLHEGWGELQYWMSKRNSGHLIHSLQFPANLVTLSLRFPATIDAGDHFVDT